MGALFGGTVVRVHVGILGPLVVMADDRPADISRSRLRTFLIRLGLDSCRLVTVDMLASALWPEDGPADPVNAVQTLDLLDLPPDAVDALRFERLARAGRLPLRSDEHELIDSRARWLPCGVDLSIRAPCTAADVPDRDRDEELFDRENADSGWLALPRRPNP